jgi:putative ABC transport system ATP-binding protein
MGPSRPINDQDRASRRVPADSHHPWRDEMNVIDTALLLDNDVATTALEAALAADDAVVVAREVTKRYGSGDAAVDALRGASVAITRSRFTAIMGPSGSGKSTLMHIMAGLDVPTAGSVLVDGVEITSLKEKQLTQLRRDKIGFIFQTFNLLPMLSARENVVLPLTIAGRPVDEDWLRSLITTVGLEDRLSHRPSELSGGQQQRVAVARALVGKPAVLFADEPTGNLDSRTGEEVLNLLRHSVEELGQTIIMVTHDAHAASKADRVLFLKDGSIVHDHGRMASADIYDVIRSLEGSS